MNDARYAVLFKTFTIDEFVIRRLAHVVAAAPSGDVFLMVDETHASAGPIAFDRVIRYREADVVGLGLPDIAQGSLFWYNADYPLYYFRHLEPLYDTVVAIEYDAVPNADLDNIVREFRRRELDFVGHTLAKTVDTYWWTGTMLRFYERAEIRPTQICAAIFSRRAIDHLAACRRRHGACDVASADSWPIGEAFVGTELTAAGFRVDDFTSFGKLTRYDWWPPIHERELPYCADELFVHPVLSGRRYMKSLFKSDFRSGLIVGIKLLAAASGRVVERWTSLRLPRRARAAAQSSPPPHSATATNYLFDRRS